MGIFTEYMYDTYRYLPDQFQGIGNCPWRVGHIRVWPSSKMFQGWSLFDDEFTGTEKVRVCY